MVIFRPAALKIEQIMGSTTMKFRTDWQNSSSCEQPAPGRFHWPDLDVDLGMESIEHPLRATVSPG